MHHVKVSISIIMAFHRKYCVVAIRIKYTSVRIGINGKCKSLACVFYMSRERRVGCVVCVVCVCMRVPRPHSGHVATSVRLELLLPLPHTYTQICAARGIQQSTIKQYEYDVCNVRACLHRSRSPGIASAYVQHTAHKLRVVHPLARIHVHHTLTHAQQRICARRDCVSNGEIMCTTFRVQNAKCATTFDAIRALLSHHSHAERCSARVHLWIGCTQFI